MREFFQLTIQESKNDDGDDPVHWVRAEPSIRLLYRRLYGRLRLFVLRDYGFLVLRRH